MANHKVLMQPAYVLHQRAYRDTSVLLELFSPEHGRIGVVAKGVKTAKSRWRGVLQPFQPLLVSWSQRGELGTLIGAEAKGPALAIAPDLIASGFYLNEILMRLLGRHEAQLELFGWYDSCLRGLAEIGAEVDAKNKSVELEILLRQFEMHLLTTLGYGLVLDQDVSTGQPLQADQEYVYQMEHGPVLVTNFVAEEMLEYGPRISGKTLLALQAVDFSAEDVRLESKRLLRSVLGNYLGSKPLHSRNLVQPVRRHQ